MNGGREGRPIGAYELAKAVEELGAGEILLNCIDCDGMQGFLLFNIHQVSELSSTFYTLRPRDIDVKICIEFLK